MIWYLENFELDVLFIPFYFHIIFFQWAVATISA